MELREKLRLVIGQNDAKPRVSWSTENGKDYLADDPEVSYEKWCNNFIDDILRCVVEK